MKTKTVYQTDQDGFFLHETIANEFVLSPGSYNIPYGAQESAPPAASAGKAARWDGTQWVLVEDHRDHTLYRTDFTSTPRADKPAKVLTVGQTVDANTLRAPDTLYTWINMGPGWSNFPNLHNAGYLHTYLLGSSTIVQELTIIETGSKPIRYHRFGNSTTWQSWRVASAFSHTYQLPNWNAGDVYLDGIGWQRWVNTPAYTGYRSVHCGQVAYFFADQALSGWLKANGAEVSRKTYVGLYSLIGNRYGGSATNFCLPDLRGEFVRSADDGRGIDPGRSLGSNQLDAFQGHWHELFYFPGQSAAVARGETTDSYGRDPIAIYATRDRVRNVIPDGVNGIPRIANETRPRNVALMAYIKI